MTGSVLRSSGRLLGVTAMLAAAVLGSPGGVLAADNTFVLDNAGSSGAPGGVMSGNYDQTFAAVEIRATPDPATGRYLLEANDGRIPLSWEYYPGNVATGTGSFVMRGTYDPGANAVTGTFTMEQEATATITTSFSGDQPLKFAMIWKGDVTGSVENNVAELYFSGANTVTCTIGADDCASGGTQGKRIWFDVSNDNYTVVPGASLDPVAITVLISGATGDVYYSPADQADLAPADRTWLPIKSGDRFMLEEGVMLRTGRTGSLKVTFTTGARFRLQPSTLFGVKKLGPEPPPMAEVYGRLFNGIADFYMKAWKDSGKKFEVDTDRVHTGIKGTTYRIEATEAATVVTVAEGVVEVTDTATGTATDVGANEQATVDASGMTKAAAPDAVALLDENAEPGASGQAAASMSAAASATPAAVAAVSPGTDAATAAPAAPSGSDSGDSSLPIVLGIVAVVVVVVVGGLVMVVRRRSASAGSAGPAGPQEGA